MLLNELDKNKKRVFYVLLLITATAGMVFAWLNFYRNQIGLAAVELLAVAISLCLLKYLSKTNSIVTFKRSALIYVSMFFSIMMYAISLQGVSITVFVWVLVIPLISYLLLGVKLGFLMTSVFYSISAILFFWGYTDYPVMVDKVAYANIFVSALLFWGISHSYEHASETARHQLRQMAVSDHLTGLFNRTAMNSLFEKTVKQAKRQQEVVSLMLFDLDRFKSINDQYGHDTGDQVLTQFAQILQSAVQDKGVSFRIGGEEFAVIYSATEESLVLALAESIRHATEQIHINSAPAPLSVSVSAGVVTAAANEAVLTDMFDTADKRMYQGKRQGRNVVVHDGLHGTLVANLPV